MAERLTLDTLADMMARFDNVPARFAVRNEATRTVLEVAIDGPRVPLRQPPDPVLSIYGIPVVVDENVAVGAIEVRDAHGRVLKTLQLFDIPETGEWWTREEILRSEPRSISGTGTQIGERGDADGESR